MSLETMHDLILQIRSLQLPNALALSYAMKLMDTNLPSWFFYRVESSHKLDGPDMAFQALCDVLEEYNNQDVFVWLLVAAEQTKTDKLAGLIKTYLEALRQSGNDGEIGRLIRLYEQRTECFSSQYRRCEETTADSPSPQTADSDACLPQIFISYKWDDTRADILAFAEYLRRSVKFSKVWIDETEMQNNALDKMVLGIETSHVVVIFWSPAYMTSRSCEVEAKTAHGSGKRLVFVKMIKDRNLAAAFGRPQCPPWFRGIMTPSDIWIDFYGENNEIIAFRKIEKAIVDFATISEIETGVFPSIIVEKLGMFPQRDKSYLARPHLEKSIRERIKQLFCGSDQIITFHGPGGIGKSWLVAESLTNANGLELLSSIGVSSIAWLNVFNLTWKVERFDSDEFFKKMIRIFNVKAGNVANNDLNDLTRHLRSSKGKVLLILDDVFDAEIIEHVQGLDPDNMRTICISRINLAEQFASRGIVGFDRMPLDPMDGSKIKQVILEKIETLRAANQIKWTVPDDKEMNEVLDRISDFCFGLVLLARIFGKTICDKRQWKYVKTYTEKLNLTYHKVLKERQKDDGKEMSVGKMLLNDFESRDAAFQQRLLAFLMFDESSLVDINELAILWQAEDEEAAEAIVKELCDASFVQSNQENTKFYIHSLLYHAVLAFVCHPDRTDVLKDDSVIYLGQSQFNVESDDIAERHQQVQQAVRKFRQNFIANMSCDSKTKENVLHRSIQLKQERLVENIDQAMIDDPEKLLFELCSQSALKAKETPLYMLLKCSNWLRDEGKEWERVYSLEKACYLADRLLRLSEKMHDNRAVDLLTNKPDSAGNTVLQLMWRSVNEANVTPTKWQRNALLVAAGNDNQALLKLMLDKMEFEDINGIVDKDGNNALMVAADNAKAPTVSDILRYRKKDGGIVIDINAKNKAGKTALMISAEWGYYFSIDYIFRDSKEPVDVNLQDEEGFTALMYAAKRDEKCVKMLLEHGSDVNLKSNNGETALWLAVASGETKIATMIHDQPYCEKLSSAEIEALKMLCKFRNFTETAELLVQWKNEDSFTDNDLLQAIAKAAMIENVFANLIGIISKNNSDLAFLISDDKAQNAAAILLASYVGNSSLVCSLIQHDRKLAKSTNKQGWTPLMLAAANGHCQLVERLSSYDALVETIEYSDTKFKRSALIWASFFGHEKVVAALISKFNCNVDARDIYHVNALNQACRWGKLECVKVLINLGNADVNSVNKDGITPLMSAITFGHVDVVCCLLSTGKVRPNVRNVHGVTAMSYASERGDVAIGELLLQDHGTDPNSATNDGTTPLNNACCEGHEEFVDLLLKVESVRRNINAARLDGVTALSWAAQKNHINIAKKLLDNGANVNVKQNDGFTPLMWASQNGNDEIVRLLLENNADVNAQSDKKATALTLASLKGFTEIVRMLLIANAHVDARSVSGFTSLMYASQNGNDEIVRLLLERNADVNVLSEKNESALTLASWQNHADIVKLLLDAGAEANVVENHNNFTALMWACENGNAKIASDLIASKADINAKSSSCFTPLMIASENGNDEIVRLLLENYED